MEKALVVDDTKNIRNLLTTCLELEGYNVITAKDGDEAIDILRNEKLGIIFLDIKMPGISGTEVLRKIRNMEIETPVIIMTAFATVKNAVDCTKMGAVAYLQKPFTADKIRNVLKELQCYTEESHIQDYISSSKYLIEAGNINEALRILKKALSIESTNGEIYYLIGDVYEKLGNLMESDRFHQVAKIFKAKGN
ncbi:response regulator [Clostridium lundense]|uniref:response regulator n=1 Tax=Clostridium lundense TaxID=319475 RepID=UPI000480570B|nr:response regulator [Clostridium lundense]